MSNESKVKSPFFEFDYNNDTLHSSKIKKGVLYMVRIQKVFDKIGELELTPDIISFVREPNIRSKLEEIVTTKSKFDLSSQELPFLMRAELVDAYFQNKISKHLQEYDNIELYLTEGEKEVFSQPIGKELFKRLGNVDENVKKKLFETLAFNPSEILISSEIYDVIFNGDADLLSKFVGDLHSQTGSEMSNSLVPHISNNLSSDHLGGKDSINNSLFFDALLRSQPATEKEKAIYYDCMRNIFQTNETFPELGEYNKASISLDKYNSLSKSFRRIIHIYLIQNFMDANKINEAQTIFPDHIDSSIASKASFGLITEGVEQTGIKEKGNNYYFDNDTSKSLEQIAMGAQYILNIYAENTNNSLALLNVQSDSDIRRSSSNKNVMSMFFNSFPTFNHEEELSEFTASNLYEYLEIKDEVAKNDFFNAYQRLFKSKGFKGQAEEPWENVVIKLYADGSMKMVVIDYLGEVDDVDESDWLNPFEFLKSDDKAVDYVRRYEFDPNIKAMQELIENEIEENKNIKKQFKLLTQSDSPLFIDESLYFQMQYASATFDQLSKLDERIVVLLPFVEQNYESYMSLLQLNELKDVNQIKKAYREAVSRDKVHPDQTNDLNEKRVKSQKLIELTNARDQLVYKINLHNNFVNQGVSMYIGNISAMLNNHK